MTNWKSFALSKNDTCCTRSGEVGLSVCLSVTFLRPVKRHESIEMPFGRRSDSGGSMY